MERLTATLAVYRRTLAGVAAAAVLWPLLTSAQEPHQDLWGGRRTFTAALSADNQTTLTDGNGAGKVSMVFDIATKTLSWEITFGKLTSAPTAIRLHGPAQPGTNAAALLDLGRGGLTSPIRGSSPVTAAHVQYLLLGWTYVSLATRRYPDGEIRGKVDVVPPPELGRRLGSR